MMSSPLCRRARLLPHTGTVLIVLFVLWCALKSSKIIAAVFITLVIGLSVTTAMGLMLVGAFSH